MADADLLTRRQAAKRYRVRVKDMAAKCCLKCQQPLGRRPSKVWTCFARFGQLLQIMAGNVRVGSAGATSSR